jgi:large subunit ribosomal protein L15
MKLNELRDNPGARQAPKRVGRGTGSGLGKTAGKGHKGAKARRSNPKSRYFEGGQMPLYRRLPKGGFTNVFKPDYVVVNIGSLQRAIDAGKLDPAQPIDAEAMIRAGLVRRVRDGIRLLAKGELSAALTVEVVGASQAARAAVERAGGKISLRGAPPSEPATT